ncbi:hypothetical protein STEG23_000363, partial [Scotinomys teguina]
MNCSGLVPLHGDLLHGGLVSSFSCCLALDPSSSCPCPTFRAIAKSYSEGDPRLPPHFVKVTDSLPVSVKRLERKTWGRAWKHVK